MFTSVISVFHLWSKGLTKLHLCNTGMTETQSGHKSWLSRLSWLWQCYVCQSSGIASHVNIRQHLFIYLNIKNTARITHLYHTHSYPEKTEAVFNIIFWDFDWNINTTCTGYSLKELVSISIKQRSNFSVSTEWNAPVMVQTDVCLCWVWLATKSTINLSVKS